MSHTDHSDVCRSPKLLLSVVCRAPVSHIFLFLLTPIQAATSFTHKYIYYTCIQHVKCKAYSLKLHPLIADCWADVNVLCSGIIDTCETVLRCPFTQGSGDAFIPWAGLVWRVTTSCHTSLSKHVKGSLIQLLALLELLCFKVLLGFQEGPFNLKPKRGKSIFSQCAWEKKAASCLCFRSVLRALSLPTN